jgi:predicted ferric reductase
MSYLVLNAAFFGFIEKFPGMNGAKLWGYLASANSLLVALPATRNSVLVWFLGFPFDKTIMFHRWLGRLILLQATIHFAHYPISVAQNYVNNQWYYGLGAWIALSLIFLTSIEWIRRRYFNFFFGSHFVFFAFYILGALHSAKSFLNLAYASAAIYGLDRLIRFAWGMFPNKTVNLEVTEGSVRVTFKKRFGANYSVGQYVFLNFPQISLFEWHPFTLASGPDERYCEVLIKGLGDHTKALISAVESKKQLFIRVDGPYGNWPFTFSRYRSIVLISGGVGVTPCISLIRHLFHINRVTFEVDPFVQDVFMVWSCKNELEYSWYKEIVEEAIAKSALKRNRYPRLHLYIHMTKSFPSANEELLPFIKQGRPNLKDVFDRVDQVNSERGYSNPRSAVIACGPEAMVSEAWDETSSRTKGKTRYDFHHETFEF